MADGVNQNGNTMVNVFGTATKYITAPNDDTDGSLPPETTKSKECPSTEDASATTLSKSAGPDQQGLPSSASVARVVGAGLK